MADLQHNLIAAAEMIEKQVDAKIDQLDNLKDEDIEQLRKKRLMELKKAQTQKEEWLRAGHGTYEEISNEKEFFDVCKKSKNVVCHFYRNTTLYCKVVDKHLNILCTKHIEARFVMINAEKCPFLVERLRIVVMPTICLAKEGKTVDFVVGFDDMGGRDDFPTEMLEWRIARSGVIEYSGDLLTPPTQASKQKKKQTKTIRSNSDDDSDDDF